MSKQNNLTDFLTDVANAIRAKKGSTDLINPQNFSAEIAALSGGLEVIDMTETTATIEPNKVYVWGMVESLDITLGASTDDSDFFAFRFRCSKPTMTSLTVNGAIWAEDTELDAQGKPVLDLGSWYQCEIKGGTSALYARLAHYIPFADSNVEAVLLANGVGDGVGVTYKDAAKVTSISTWFKGNADITAFSEFVNFSGIRTIDDGAFRNCTSLAEITLPNTLTSIGGNTFYGCTSLAEITLPASLTSIGGSTFNSCSLLTSVINLENTKVTSIGAKTFQGCSSLTEITFPSSLTKILNGAFQVCSSLAEITFPDTLTIIGQYAFLSCKSLTRVVNLENTQLTSISDELFSGCSSLTEITLPAGVTSIGTSAFRNCSALAEIALPSSLTSIGSGAFNGCKLLARVLNLENTQLTKILNGAFNGCTALAEITFPNTLTSIGQYAFLNCKSLTRVVNLENTQLTSISSELFSGCSSLTEIALPAGVTSIGSTAFYGCSSLQYIRIEATTPPTLSSTNAIPSSIVAIYVPDGSVAAYQAATNWSSFASKIKGISEMPAE